MQEIVDFFMLNNVEEIVNPLIENGNIMTTLLSVYIVVASLAVKVAWFLIIVKLPWWILGKMNHKNK